MGKYGQKEPLPHIRNNFPDREWLSVCVIEQHKLSHQLMTLFYLFIKGKQVIISETYFRISVIRDDTESVPDAPDTPPHQPMKSEICRQIHNDPVSVSAKSRHSDDTD